MNNNISIKLRRYHANGVIGTWDVNSWYKAALCNYTEQFPLSHLFPVQDDNVCATGIECRIEYVKQGCTPILLSIPVNGRQRNLPSLCLSLLSADDTYISENLTLLVVMWLHTGMFDKMMTSEEPWCRVLHDWLHENRVFIADSWDALFSDAERYSFVFEQVPASIPINASTIQWIDKHKLEESVRSRFNIFHAYNKIVGIIKDDENQA